MLFNSYTFLFVFLPVCLLGYYLLGRIDNRLAMLWLAVMSFVFYAQADASYVFLLAASIAFNFACGRAILHLVNADRRNAAKVATTFAVGANLAVLAYYKYGGFVFANVTAAFGLAHSVWTVVLPVGISFYTFTQIAFLVDAFRGRVRQSGPIEYALFVTYFPHLIAGPILHHSEMIPQFLRKQASGFSASNLSVGFAIFIIGLSKKILLADSLAPYANSVFAAKHTVTFADAWIGSLAYTLQLYFDFSGYCDMAVGLSKMFNIDLPLNFYSPYKATSIIEFWRRWHMTLSRFLRDYLYIPLGGNRRGPRRRNINLMVTMVLGGLWHGAAWTFVVWGALHGLFLLINHAFRAYASPRLISGLAFRIFGWALTMACVVVAWVFFRAESIGGAFSILESMANPWRGLSPSVPVVALEPRYALFLILIGFAIALLCPNVQQMFKLPFHPQVGESHARAGDHPDIEIEGPLAQRLAWRPSLASAVILGFALAACVMLFVRTTTFLYFQF